MTPEEAFDAALHHRWVILPNGDAARCSGADWRFPTVVHPRTFNLIGGGQRNFSFDYTKPPRLLVTVRGGGCGWYAETVHLAPEDEAVLAALGRPVGDWPPLDSGP